MRVDQDPNCLTLVIFLKDVLDNQLLSKKGKITQHAKSLALEYQHLVSLRIESPTRRVLHY